MALTAAGCSVNQLRKLCFFTAIRQIYNTLVSIKKTTAFTAARFRENWPNRLISILDKKSTTLTVAVCIENKLRKVGIIKEIGHSYKA